MTDTLKPGRDSMTYLSDLIIFFGGLVGMIDTVSFLLGAALSLTALFAFVAWDDARTNGR